MKSPHKFLRVALLLLCGSALAWTYRWVQTRRKTEREQALQTTLDFRAVAPIGYEFCAGKSRAGDDRVPDRLQRQNLRLRIVLPDKITDLPPDAPFGAKEIVFHPGKTDVDLYQKLTVERLFHTHGTIEKQGANSVLQVDLNLAAWPAGRYILGIGGDPFFAYCTVETVN
jgi:hypothetical protein